MIVLADNEAEVMTIDEFLEQCDYGNITENDGVGYLGYKDRYDNECMVWDDALDEESLHDYTHIHWFNR